MEEVLEVYQRPYTASYPVICMDEAPRQLISEIRAGFTDEKGVLHQDYEYKQAEVAEVFRMAEPLAGQQQVIVTDSHSSQQWAKVVAKITEAFYPMPLK